MEFHPCTMLLPGGMSAVLRSPRPQDAAEMLRYKKQMCAETEFVGRYPEEVTETLAEEEATLAAALASDNSILISVFTDGKIAANAGALPISGRIKLQHRAELCIAVLKPWWHMGLGRRLVRECTAAALEMGYESVELSASAANETAIKLYEQCGFVEYGRLKNAYRLKGGAYDDSVFMVTRP